MNETSYLNYLQAVVAIGYKSIVNNSIVVQNLHEWLEREEKGGEGRRGKKRAKVGGGERRTYLSESCDKTTVSRVHNNVLMAQRLSMVNTSKKERIIKR